MSSTFYLIGIGFFVGIAAWFLFIWAVKSCQFDEPAKAAKPPKLRTPAKRKSP